MGTYSPSTCDFRRGRRPMRTSDVPLASRWARSFQQRRRPWLAMLPLQGGVRRRHRPCLWRTSSKHGRTSRKHPLNSSCNAQIDLMRPQHREASREHVMRKARRRGHMALFACADRHFAVYRLCHGDVLAMYRHVWAMYRDTTPTAGGSQTRFAAGGPRRLLTNSTPFAIHAVIVGLCVNVLRREPRCFLDVSGAHSMAILAIRVPERGQMRSPAATCWPCRTSGGEGR